MRTLNWKRALFASLFVLIFLASFVTPAAQEQLASNKPEPRKAPAARTLPLRRVVLRGVIVADGSRVTITSDAPLDDYAAYRDGNRYYVRVPHATASPAVNFSNGKGYSDARVEQRVDDLLVSFKIEPGTAARVAQKFNRLDVIFAAQDQQSGNGNAITPPAKPASDSNPNPTPSPATTTAPPVSPINGAPAETKAAGSSEAVKATAPVTGTNAERFAAYLTPEKKNPVTVTKFDKPPVIDGKLDDEVWKNAARFKDFIQNRPGELTAPSKQTEAYIGYDAKFFYVAFKAFDEPDKIRSTVAKRDSVFDDDWVGVWLDTFNDGRRAYELLFNPLGVQADAVFTEGVNEDFSVDIVHESKGTITSDGYVVEIAIPFKSLRYTAGKDKLWGLHLLRTIKRFNNEQSSWMPISRDNSSLLGQRGYITGLDGISAERTLEIIPSLTISQSGTRVNSPVPGSPIPLNLTSGPPTDRLLNKPIEFDPGVSLKYTITPQVTLDFTYNPDFAQVEADATVVTANQRFPIFFEEKRPFFLEGKEIFETLISAVHTRAIVDPDYALKLTGKQGRNTFGFMAASDKAPGNLDDDQRNFIAETINDPFNNRRDSLLKILDKNATIGVMRLKRDIGKENHIGLLATTYNFIDKYNHVAGFDTRWRLNKTTTFTAQALGSVSSQPFFYPDEAIRDDRQEKGMVYGAYLNMSGRNWGYELGAVGRSRYFRADVGFNRRFNTNNPTIFVRYNSTDKPKATLVVMAPLQLLRLELRLDGPPPALHQRVAAPTPYAAADLYRLWLREGIRARLRGRVRRHPRSLTTHKPRHLHAAHRPGGDGGSARLRPDRHAPARDRRRPGDRTGRDAQASSVHLLRRRQRALRQTHDLLLVLRDGALEAIRLLHVHLV